jgi:hypothetical protein
MIITEDLKKLVFHVVGDMAPKNDVAKLYWMCLGRLSSQEEYQKKSPEEIHDEIRKLAIEVYKEKPFHGIQETIDKKIKKYLL